MIRLSLPVVMKDGILQDAIRRDITTARRIALLEILWHERYLTRAQLIARVEMRLGKNCFGVSAWKDTFYRDMRFVKQAFDAAGYRLLYSRNKQQPGYYLAGQPALSAEIQQVLKSSAADVDQHQIDIYHKLSFAERFYQGCSISDTARKVVAYRIRQDNPKLSLVEANRMALQRAYSHCVRRLANTIYSGWHMSLSLQRIKRDNFVNCTKLSQPAVLMGFETATRNYEGAQ